MGKGKEDKEMRGRMKKIVSCLLAVALAAMVCVPTLALGAQEGSKTGGSITIDNAVAGHTYSVYQLLYLESYDVSADAYTYKANSAWENWLKTQTSYVSIDSQGYVTWVSGASAADFAKLAQAHAKTDNIASDPAAVTATSATVSFTGLKLGYYLVDSTMGTLCSLDTTNPSVTIKEKNEVPGNEKTVEEDSTGSYGSVNDADIGQTVNFKSAITAQAGAQNYVFHDEMSSGLTFGSVTDITLNSGAVGASNYTIKTSDLGDSCTFHVVFTQTFCDTLKANDKIVISYTATLNENAVVGGSGNKNESWLEYGDDSETTKDTTTTYTWDVDVFKYTTEGENKAEVALAGATFTLNKNTNETNPIALVREKDGQGNDTNTYRVAKTDETGTVTEITTDDTGEFTVKGLDSGTYYLTETMAPAGYNKLADPVTIVIDKDGVVNGTTDVSQGVDKVKVLNQSGSELPSTGGMGTTVLYVVGGLLVVCAGVGLVARRRARSGR